MHIDGDEYVHVDTPAPGEHALLPVATGTGEALVDQLETGSSLLTLDESGATAPAAGETAPARAPQVFRVGPDGLVRDGDDAPDGGALIRTPDGRERRVRALEPRD